jgi:carbamoyltransferase
LSRQRRGSGRRRRDRRRPGGAFYAPQARRGLPAIRHRIWPHPRARRQPFLQFEPLLETYLAFAPRGLASFQRALPLWLREKLYQKKLLLRQLRQLAPDVDCSGTLRFTEHHQAHAASAFFASPFFASPFQEAVVLTLDGAGEWTTTSVAIGRGSQLEIVREIHFPQSLG